jgi:type IV pilus assembly protein PilY1
MDEDFYGNAVGSYSPASKAVQARQALQNVVTDLQYQANVGIMTYTLPGDVSAYYIHNAMPFASYNPNSYCPNPHPDPSDPLYIATWPPAACQTYCMSQDSTAQSECEAACPGLTSTNYQHYYGRCYNHSGQTNNQQCANNSACPGTYPTCTAGYMTTGFPDLIITNYSTTTDPTSTRARYCGLAYPKTQRWQNPTDPQGRYVYYNQTDPFYDTSNDGIMFGYSGGDVGAAYSPAENYANTYTYCTNKNETNDNDIWTGYSGNCTNYQFEPTDSDYALGFYNWGQQMPWYYVGPTWFSDSSPPSGSPQGYLHVGIGALSNSTQFNAVNNILNPNVNNSSTTNGYMSCTASNKNTCSYIVNAANTPTAGTLQTALNYYNGTYTNPTTNQVMASPITSTCQQNFIIYVTDGLPDTMLNGSQSFNQYCYNGSGQTNNQACGGTTGTTCPTAYPDCVTTGMGQALSELAQLQTNVQQTIGGTKTTFPVQTYVLGVGMTTTAETNLDQMAAAGGTLTTSGHAYYANNPSELTEALQAIMTNLTSRVAAGSSISILSEGQSQSGANMLQGVFYPNKYFGSTAIDWPGYLYNYWFYNSTSYSNIREDTVHDYILELNEDDGLSFDFSPQTGLSVNRYSDPNGSGNPSVFVDNVGLDSLTPIWEAGKMLFQASAASRTIYTPGNSSTGLVSFNTSNSTLTAPATSPLGSPSSFNSCLQVASTNSNWQTLTLQNLINYVTGVDISGCRNRTVGLCSNGTSFSNTPCESNGDCAAPYSTCTTNVWKLGDIVYSSPKVQSDYMYCSDTTGTNFSTQVCTTATEATNCTNPSYPLCSKKESIVYVGANDGMLHAFKTGVLNTTNLSNFEVDSLTGIPTSSMGSELWAFIPTNSLPYLRCLAVPSGCHLYYNDLSPYITTMNVNGLPRTVLIGGMRLGGAAISSGQYCFNNSGVSNGSSCTQASTCTAPYNASCSTTYYLNAPSDTCSSLSSTTTLQSAASLCSSPATCYNPSTCTGLSEYYAIDITDPQKPTLLWEFTHPYLGYTYSGPAVIHKWSNATNYTGDQYYVMFLSGPTIPSVGSSIQDVQAFVLSLNTNLGISSVYYKDLGSSTANGFGGRLFTNGLDVNGDGYTDFVFFGYANSPTGSTTGWSGGIGKVNTNNTDPTAALNPANWTYDVTSYSSIATQPITSQVAAEQCFGTWYLYAGAGRYFFQLDNYIGPSNSGLNYLMGIPFTCDQYNNGCTAVSSLNNSAGACSSLQQGQYSQAGWEYSLSAASGNFLIERMITDPTVYNTSTTPYNKVYMTTSQPASDPCSYGGQSRVWGLNCATGAAITDTSCSGYQVTDLNGTVYLQTSTGAINQITDSSSFTNTSTGNRATNWYVGMPPETSPPDVLPFGTQTKSGQLIQWIER